MVVCVRLRWKQRRYYNPWWGRFISADSILGEVGGLLQHNLWAYCKNSPIRLSDVSGKDSRDVILMLQNNTSADFTSDELVTMLEDLGVYNVVLGDYTVTFGDNTIYPEAEEANNNIIDKMSLIVTATTMHALGVGLFPTIAGAVSSFMDWYDPIGSIFEHLKIKRGTYKSLLITNTIDGVRETIEIRIYDQDVAFTEYEVWRGSVSLLPLNPVVNIAHIEAAGNVKWR